MIDSLRQDIAYAVRTLSRSPGFFALAVLTLGIGVAATTAIFSVVHPVLIAPLPFEEPDELVLLWEDNLSMGQTRVGVSPPNLTDWRRESRRFSAISILSETTALMTVEGIPQRLSGGVVSPEFFDLLGTGAERGRTFFSGEGGPGTPDIMILSHDLWRGRFGGDPGVIGSSLTLGDTQRQVVGVLSPDFQFLDRHDFWVPKVFGSDELGEELRGARYLRVLGRLEKGVSARQGVAELSAITHQLAANADWSVSAEGLREHVVGDARLSVLALFCAVILVLLIGCANVAGLLMSRAAGREHEMAVRAALGAARWRLLRQLLTESLLLALAAGLLGAVAALWLLEPLLALAPTQLPEFNAVTVNRVVLVFSLLLSIGTSLVFGLLPALDGSRLEAGRALGRVVSARSPRGHLRSVLVAGEVALSVVLLVAAGLMLQSFVRLNQVELGFEPDGLTTFFVSLPSSAYPTADVKASAVERLQSEVATLPGVISTGASTNAPLSGSSMTFGFRPVAPSIEAEGQQFAQYHATTPGYFRALGIPLIQGRDFTEGDRLSSQPVVIVNEALARRYWPDGSAVGRRLVTVSQTGETEREVVGIVPAVKHGSLDASQVNETYVPFAQDSWSFVTFGVRHSLDSATLAAQLRRALTRVDPALPLEGLGTMRQRIGQLTAPARFQMVLLLVFSSTALLLAVIGLYGALSFLVVRSRHSIGVRLALGAPRRQILSRVVARGLLLTLAGVAVGLVGAVAAGRLIAGLLFEVSPAEPLILVAVSALFVVTAAVASYLPARRAANLDPIQTLRSD